MSDIQRQYNKTKGTLQFSLIFRKLKRHVFKRKALRKDSSFKLHSKSDYILNTWRKSYINVIPELQKEIDFEIKDEKSVFTLGGMMFCPHSLHFSNKQLYNKFLSFFKDCIFTPKLSPSNIPFTYTLEDVADNVECGLDLMNEVKEAGPLRPRMLYSSYRNYLNRQ